MKLWDSTAQTLSIRKEYVNDTSLSLKGGGKRNVENAIRDVLGYRLYHDLASRLAIKTIQTLSSWDYCRCLMRTCRIVQKITIAGKMLRKILKQAQPERRAYILKTVLDAMRKGAVYSVSISGPGSERLIKKF